jgi:hypothetical protein
LRHTKKFNKGPMALCVTNRFHASPYRLAQGIEVIALLLS